MSDERIAFSLSFPAQPEYLVLGRLAVAALARLAPIDEELVDDLKLAVTEACTNTIQHAYRNREPGRVELRYEVEAGLVRITIEDSGVGHNDELPESNGEREGGMGLAIIRSLVDDLDLEPGPGGLGTRVTLAKRL
jgi:serine/threonine-protein kinase RsbW